MDNKNAWEEFLQTGSIYAYLQYKGINCKGSSDISVGGDKNVGVFYGRTDNKDHRYR